MWLVLTEETKGPVKQTVVVKTHLPTDELKLTWKQGKKVTLMAYGKDKWVIVSEPVATRGPIRQSFFASDTGFPTEKIKEFYARRKRIHSFIYVPDEDIWAFLLEPRLDTQPQQRVFFSPDFPRKNFNDFAMHTKNF
eukprot:TRINITY_DN10922_c0_g1_i1.p1 TRINITY_DN10922_c0_g1~~TRINITY_DN10922_c0_g1_i1.p1  ORF type:complete len:137 (+),score=16.56 TRINITY_DN10922_c0_g1_i1:79-489(+)